MSVTAAALVVVALLAGLVHVATNDLFLFPRLDPGTVATVLAVLALYGGALALVIRRLDRWRTLRTATALTATAWGALVATSLAGGANADVDAVVGAVLGADTAATWAGAVSAPLVEETLKALGVIAAVLVARRALTGPLEGMALGALSGLGFQLEENLGYLQRGMWSNPTGDGAGALQVLAARIVGGLGGHWCYSALAGLAVGLLLTRVRGDRRTVGLAVAACLAAVGAHALNNAPGLTSSAAGIVGKVLLVLAVTAIAVRAARRAQWWRAAAVLGAEPAGIASAAERAELRTPRTARTARRATRREVGREAARSHRRRQRALVRLASARLAGEPDDDLRAALRPGLPGRTPAAA